MKQFLWHQYRVQITEKNVKMTNMRIHQDDPTLILMSIPYGMSYDAGLHTLEQPRIRQWLKNYEKKQITLPTTEDRLEKERLKRLHAEEYRRKLLAVIPEMFRKWEPILGVQSAKVTIRPTRSQWGSCNTRNGNISISLWLGAYPEECIEYVVVHELTHLLERGHNARFYGLLDQHYPDWKTCRERLKQDP